VQPEWREGRGRPKEWKSIVIKLIMRATLDTCGVADRMG